MKKIFMKGIIAFSFIFAFMLFGIIKVSALDNNTVIIKTKEDMAVLIANINADDADNNIKINGVAVNKNITTILVDSDIESDVDINTDIRTAGNTLIIKGREVTVKSTSGNKKSLIGYSFNAQANGKLTFEDIIIDGKGLRITSAGGNHHNLIDVSSSGSEINIKSGAVIQNFQTNKFSVLRATGGASINIYDGSVLQNLMGDTGTIRLESSTGNIYGGLITNCGSYNARYNEGLIFYSMRSTVNITGGTIENNISATAPGVVYLHGAGNSTFKMTGGIITNNSATYGGVVYDSNNQGSNKIIIGGKITATDNQGSRLGGESNIYLRENGYFEILSDNHLEEGSSVGVYSSDIPTETKDIMIAIGANKNDIKYIHSDLPDNAGVVFCDGQNDYIWNGKEYEQVDAKHEHLANTIWLSVAAKNYGVTYNGNGNDFGYVPTDNTRYINNKNVIVLDNSNNLTKNGYKFVGWSTEANGSGTIYKAGDTFQITSDTTLYAKWEINKYTVTFNTNGGNDISNQTVEYRNKVTKPSNPTKEKFTFVDWYEDTILTTPFDFNKEIIKDMAIYAKWSYNSLLSIDTYLNGHITYTPSDSELDYEDMVQSIRETTKGTYNVGAKADDGYWFVKWTLDGEDYSEDSEITITLGEEDLNLVAVFDVVGELEVKEVEDNFGNATSSLNNQNVKDLIDLDVDDEQAIATGKNIYLFVEVDDISDSVSDTDKKLVENKLDKNSKVGMYLDINLFKQIEGEEKVKVSETNGKIKISFEIPQSLRRDNRTFYMIRVHDGVATKLSTTLDGNILSFETDEFSTYALAYTDAIEKVSSNPKTVDNIFNYIVLLIMSIIGLAGSGIYISRKKLFNK